MIRVLLVLLALTVAAPPAAADSDSVRRAILAELQQDGYAEVRISRTLLGRMRFEARKRDAEREIVVNPTTGVILRDYVRLLRIGDGNDDGIEDLDEDPDDKDDDDDPDKDESDDDARDDNSGSGSSNSGSGSDDSGSGSSDDDD